MTALDAGTLSDTLYNPLRLTREALIAGFTARRDALEDLLSTIRKQPKSGHFQHALIVGSRGMGKTTLLLRLRYAIEDDPALAKLWEPVTFAEENYQIGDLADLWLTTLESITATCEDREPAEIAARLRGSEESAELLEARALEALRARVKASGRRLVLFVDNFDMILAHIADQVQHYRLRKLLIEDDTFLLIGAASSYFGEITDYDKPFYEFFKEVRLRALGEVDLTEVVRARAKAVGDRDVLDAIDRQSGRVRGLWRLTGGNPRMATMIYHLLRETPLGSIRADLDRLLEQVTPYYKHRIESLPEQQRRVLDAIARSWDPVLARDIAARTRVPVTSVSAQLTRLIERGFVEEVDAPGKRKSFQVAERFFNIFYLMRFHREGRRRLGWLARFMELFYEPQQLQPLAESMLKQLAERPHLQGEVLEDCIDYLMCIADVTKDAHTRSGLLRGIREAAGRGLETSLAQVCREQSFGSAHTKRLLNQALSAASAGTLSTGARVGATEVALNQHEWEAVLCLTEESDLPRDGDIEELRVKRVVALHALGRREEALELLRTLASILSHVAYRLFVVYMLLRLGEEREAASVWSSVTDDEISTLPATKMFTSIIEASAGEVANDLFDRASRLRAFDEELAVAEAFSLVRRLRFAEAIKVLERADAPSASAYHVRVIALVMLGRTSEALTEARSGLERWPDAVPTNVALGVATVGSKPREALEAFRRASSLAPEDATAWYALALFAVRKPKRVRREEARMACDRAIELAPTNPAALLVAAQEAAASRDAKRALSISERLFRNLGPDFPDAGIIELACSIAAMGEGVTFARLMDETGISAGFEPLRLALGVISGEDSERLRAVAQEVAGVTADVVARILDLRRAQETASLAAEDSGTYTRAKKTVRKKRARARRR